MVSKESNTYAARAKSVTYNADERPTSTSRDRDERVSLHPLDPADALRALLQPPRPKD
jgi:hypothetical protein